MKLIFDSEEEKNGFAFDAMDKVCPDHFLSIEGWRDIRCDDVTCMECWRKALEKLEVKNND